MGHKVFAIGIVCILMGVQMRMVESFVLTPKASQFVERNIRSSGLRTQGSAYDIDPILLAAGPTPKKTLTPPRWLGWAVMSAGAILTLHGLTLRRLG